jgi:diacylglycerol kinase
MRELLRRHTVSFKNAFAGIVWALQTQPNFRIHVTLSLIAILLGLWLGITFLEMTVIVFTIILGLSSEMINTAIEAMTDLITTEYHKEAKIAKDVAAGMMLMTAIGAVLIACFVYGPYLWRLRSF